MLSAKLLSSIQGQWWITDPNYEAELAGPLISTFPGPTLQNNPIAGGITFSQTGVQRFRQFGYVERIVYSVGQVGLSDGWNIKICSPEDSTGTNWTVEWESGDFTPAGTGVQEYVLPTPLAVEAGWTIGVWARGHATVDASRSKVRLGATSGTTLRRDANISGTGNALGAQGSFSGALNISAMGRVPSLIVAGDSWAEGFNNWSSMFNSNDSLEGSDNTFTIGHKMEVLRPGLYTQTWAKGGEKYENVSTTRIASIVAQLGHLPIPVAAFISGGNDALVPETVETLRGHLDSIREDLPSSIKMAISEAGPRGSGNSSAILSYNEMYADWCAENDQIFMGGIYDAFNAGDHTIKPELTDDGTHPNSDGQTVIAELWLNAIDAYFAGQ